jgi:hypothetical protein
MVNRNPKDGNPIATDTFMRAVRRQQQGEGFWDDHVRGSVQDRIAGKNVAERVTKAGPRKEVIGGDVNPARGFSNEVSKGRRPVHKAGSWASRGIGKFR